MAYLAPQFENDIFLSYARVDNESAFDDEGWVDTFKKLLEIELSKLVGRIGVIKIWMDVRQLDSNQSFDDEIRNQIRASGVFLALTSRGYLHRECYCRNELAEFYRKAQEEPETLLVGTRSRIVNALLYNINHDDWPAEYRGITASKLFDVSETDVGEPSSTDGELFEQQVKELARELYKLLNDLKKKTFTTQAPSPTPSPHAVDPQSMANKIRRKFRPDGMGSSPPFVFAEDAVLAINVALAANLPMLIRGPHGAGKSSLVRAIAELQKWKLYECQLTSSTTATELLYYYDQFRHLNDAQVARDLRGIEDNVSLGCLGAAIANQESAVVLIEDIDIATVSVQRDILHIIGRRAFTVKGTSQAYNASDTAELLFVFTTEDRERLPDDFLRLTVVLTLASPTLELLVNIGKVHHSDASVELLRSLAARMIESHARSNVPLTAGEFLNVLSVVRNLNVSPDKWERIFQSIALSRAPYSYEDPGPVPFPEDSAPNKIREYRQGSCDVFLSYAREDVSSAELLAQRLIDEGLSVFWDRQVQPGEQWEIVIEEALSSAKCVVVLWSNSSVRSQWVRSEATDGAEREILVPAMLEKVSLPLRFKSRQCADLTDWATKQNDTPAIAALLSAVRRTIAIK